MARCLAWASARERVASRLPCYGFAKLCLFGIPNLSRGMSATRSFRKRGIVHGCLKSEFRQPLKKKTQTPSLCFSLAKARFRTVWRGFNRLHDRLLPRGPKETATLSFAHVRLVGCDQRDYSDFPARPSSPAISITGWPFWSTQMPHEPPS